MTRPDVHTLVGAYILDALDTSESAEVDEHLAACEACAEEVAELRSVTNRLAADVATQPPASLRAAVLGEVARTRQLPPRPTVSSPSRSKQSRPAARERRWQRGRGPLVAVAAMLAATLAVACVSLGFVVTDQRAELDATKARANALTALASAAIDGPAASTVAGGGRIAVVGAGEQALLVTRDLPELPDGRTYQLWLVDDDSVRSAGFVDDDRSSSDDSDGGGREDDRLVSITDVHPTDTDLAVTVEPDGGSTQPTTPILASLPLRT